MDHSVAMSSQGRPLPEQSAASVDRLRSLDRIMVVLLAICSLLALSALILAARSPDQLRLAPTPLTLLLAVNAAFLLAAALLTAQRMRPRDERFGARRLHLRLALLFSFAAAVPAVIVAGALGVAANRLLDDWLSDRVGTLIENSASAARSFVSDQERDIRQNVRDMAIDLANAYEGFRDEPERFQQYLLAQASYRNFSAARIIDGRGKTLAGVSAPGAPDLPRARVSAQADADAGLIGLDVIEDLGAFSAVSRLDRFGDAYLQVLRVLDDPRTLDRLREAEAALVDLRAARANARQLEAAFSIAFVQAAIVLVLAAVTAGLFAARRVTRPIGRLVTAAERVSAGELSQRVPASGGRDEVEDLTRAFNAMTERLSEQRADIEASRADALARSRYIEAVLAHVSSGVLRLSPEGTVEAANDAALELFSVEVADLNGRELADLAPEIARMLAERSDLTGDIDFTVRLEAGDIERELRVQVAPIVDGAGYVLTLDDMTRLIASQRQAAWRDVARRIAHEIRNPLTPIQLSAERLQRKYRGRITEDADVFDRCVATIVRQVGDIRRMVDAFSAFARMPKPVFENAGIGEVVDDAVFAKRLDADDVRLTRSGDAGDATVHADSRLLSQAVTNLLNNADDAIAARRASDPTYSGGAIDVRLHRDGRWIVLDVIDDALGFPASGRSSLLEPYVTTREQGMGLGLAIVGRIIADHGGDMALLDRDDGVRGARVRVRLPEIMRNEDNSDGEAA